jgi:ribosomal protection tetracycline resistance protein
VHDLQQQLPGLTAGEGALGSAFDRYEPANNGMPARLRSDKNPLNREEYLLQLAGRTGARL